MDLHLFFLFGTLTKKEGYLLISQFVTLIEQIVMHHILANKWHAAAREICTGRHMVPLKRRGHIGQSREAPWPLEHLTWSIEPEGHW
jgi:hypothetical protein